VDRLYLHRDRHAAVLPRLFDPLDELRDAHVAKLRRHRDDQDAEPLPLRRLVPDQLVQEVEKAVPVVAALPLVHLPHPVDAETEVVDMGEDLEDAGRERAVRVELDLHLADPRAEALQDARQIGDERRLPAVDAEVLRLHLEQGPYPLLEIGVGLARRDDAVGAREVAHIRDRPGDGPVEVGVFS